MFEHIQNLQLHGCIVENHSRHTHYHRYYPQRKTTRHSERRSYFRARSTTASQADGSQTEAAGPSLSLSVIQSPLSPGISIPVRIGEQTPINVTTNRNSTDARQIQRQNHTLDTLTRAMEGLSSRVDSSGLDDPPQGPEPSGTEPASSSAQQGGHGRSNTRG
ncbi:hypothetical protein BKA70DRAFT_1216612 [Coprinopsis sp. MPI-PUGE-AT-0042]|nr:hypothetical protein BKA70DRAFT_1216612 [Coprinopsis sp. MPI-PUGE-AT-0042]